MPLRASTIFTRATSSTETSRECVTVLNFVSRYDNTPQTNILVNDSGRALIADFGLAIITRGVDSELSTTGDEGHGARWSAPEILTDQGVYSKEADVFSFAMVMNQVGRGLSTMYRAFPYHRFIPLQVLNGAVPFHDKTPAAAAFAILKGFRPPRPKDPTVTEKLWILMDRSWAQEPHLRPDILEVLQGLRTPSVHNPSQRPPYMTLTISSNPVTSRLGDRLSTHPLRRKSALLKSRSSSPTLERSRLSKISLEGMPKSSLMQFTR